MRCVNIQFNLKRTWIFGYIAKYCDDIVAGVIKVPSVVNMLNHLERNAECAPTQRNAFIFLYQRFTLFMILLTAFPNLPTQPLTVR